MTGSPHCYACEDPTCQTPLTEAAIDASPNTDRLCEHPGCHTLQPSIVMTQSQDGAWFCARHAVPPGCPKCGTALWDAGYEETPEGDHDVVDCHGCGTRWPLPNTRARA